MFKSFPSTSNYLQTVPIDFSCCCVLISGIRQYERNTPRLTSSTTTTCINSKLKCIAQAISARQPTTQRPRPKDPRPNDPRPRDCDAKEARVQEAEGQEARVQEARIQLAWETSKQCFQNDSSAWQSIRFFLFGHMDQCPQNHKRMYCFQGPEPNRYMFMSACLFPEVIPHDGIQNN